MQGALLQGKIKQGTIKRGMIKQALIEKVSITSLFTQLFLFLFSLFLFIPLHSSSWLYGWGIHSKRRWIVQRGISPWTALHEPGIAASQNIQCGCRIVTGWAALQWSKALTIHHLLIVNASEWRVFSWFFYG